MQDIFKRLINEIFLLKIQTLWLEKAGFKF